MGKALKNTGQEAKKEQQEEKKLPETFESVEAALKWAAGEIRAKRLGSLYASPKIPKRKWKNAVRKYAKEVSAEDILLLYDSTVFGSGKNGILLTRDRFYWKQDLYKGSAPLNQVRMRQISPSYMMLYANDMKYKIVMARGADNLDVVRPIIKWLAEENAAENPESV